MFQDILNQVVTTGIGLIILGAAYLLDLLIGSIKVWFTAGMKWSIKKAGEDFLKAVVLAIGVEAWVVLWNFTSYYCAKCGVDIKTIADGFSTAGMVSAILGATCWYLKNAFTNAVKFIETKHIDVKVGEIKYDEIAEKVYKIFETPKEAVEAHKEFEEKKEAEEEPLDGGLGAHYSVPHANYDEFRAAVISKGFDCDGAYSFQCLTAGHYVSMADGTYKDVADIKIGDRVVNHNGESLNTIIRVIKQKRPVVKYNTSSNTFICTEDHKIFRASGEKCSIKDLKTPAELGGGKEYDAVEFPVAHCEYEHGLTDDELRWLGFYLGDGTKKYRWANSKKPEAFITVGVKRKYEYLEGLDIDQVTRTHSNGKARTYNLVNQSHPALCDYINQIDGKELPREFNAREYALIIEGYLAADGCDKGDGRYIITSTCKPLLLSIQYGCMLNGWAAKIGKESNRGTVCVLGKDCNSKPIWQMSIRKDKEFASYYQSTSEVIGEEDIYIITTDGDHSYIADNNGVQNCWDGACLLWMQLGRWLNTGDGSAKGCWNLKRNENAGNDFELITNLKDVQRGDVVFFGCGQFGHVGYADEDYNGCGYIKLLGQNQSSDMKFCVINMSTASFLGAMRLKTWKRVNPTPAPAPAPTKKGYITYTYKAGDTFGQVLCNLGLDEGCLWGPDGTVAYYTKQLNEQGIVGNIPIGATIKLTPRK